jgi:hypothetical protein
MKSARSFVRDIDWRKILRKPHRGGNVRPKAHFNGGVKVPFGQQHWLSVAGGNCVVERRGGEQPEANR